MAWARVQSKSNSSTASTTVVVTLTGTPVTGNKVAVFVSCVNGPTVTTVKDGNNVSLTLGATSTNAGNEISYLYFYDVPASPSTTFTVTGSGSANFGCDVLEVSGLLAGNTTACLDGTAGVANGTTSPAAPTYSSTAANEFLFAYFGDWGNGSTCTVPSGLTLDANSINTSTNANSCVAYGNTSGGSDASSWAFTAAPSAWAVFTGAFKLAAATATASPVAFVPRLGNLVGGSMSPMRLAEKVVYDWLNPPIDVNDAAAPDIQHQAFDATVQLDWPVILVQAPRYSRPPVWRKGSVLPIPASPDVSVSAGAADIQHITADPSVELDVPDVTAPAITHTAYDATVSISVPDVTAPDTQHQTFDATVGLVWPPILVQVPPRRSPPPIRRGTVVLPNVASTGITRITGGSASSAAATAYTVTLNPGCLAGDLLVVGGGSNGTHATNGMAVQDSVNSVAFTTILEQQGGTPSTRWLQTFMYRTPVDLPTGTTVSFTPYAASTGNGFTVDVFRGATDSIAQAAVGSSNASATTASGPALAAAPAAGSLVLTFCGSPATTLTPGTPFAAGASVATNNAVASGWVGPTGADGSSTYGSTWTLGAANTSATQTVALSSSGNPDRQVTDAAAPDIQHLTFDATVQLDWPPVLVQVPRPYRPPVWRKGVVALAVNPDVNVSDVAAPDIQHVAADPAPALAVPDATAPAITHTTNDAVSGLGVTDTPPALAHTTQDATVTLSVNDTTAPAITHQAFDATVQIVNDAVTLVQVPRPYRPPVWRKGAIFPATADVIVNVNAGTGDLQHITSDATNSVGVPDAAAPDDQHITAAPSPGVGYPDVTAPALAHSTFNAVANNIGVTDTPPALAHGTFDASVSVTVAAEGTFVTLVANDCTIFTTTAPPPFVDVGGSTSPAGGLDGTASGAGIDGSAQGAMLDRGGGSGTSPDSGGLSGPLVG